MRKIIVTRGLPCSGKTTYVKEFCKKNPNFIRINEDDIKEIFCIREDSDRYNFLYDIKEKAVESGLILGFDIIIDECILHKEDIDFAEEAIAKYRSLSENFKVQIEYKDFFDINIDEILENNDRRENSIGVEAIASFYEDFVNEASKGKDSWYGEEAIKSKLYTK